MGKACGVAFVAFLLSSLSAGQDDARLDQYGDALPTGAIQRFGSVAFRHPMRCYAADVSPDGKLLASGDGAFVYIWNRDTGERLWRHPFPCTAVAFSHGGNLLACAGRGGEVQLWDVTRRAELFSAQHPKPPREDGTVFQIEFFPDNLTFATVGGDNDVRIWDTTTGRDLAAFRHGGRVASQLRLAISPDGQRLASSCGPSIRIWNMQQGGEPVVVPAAHGRGVTALAFSSDGHTLLSAGLRTERVVDQENHSSRINAYAGIRTWDAATGQERVTLHDELSSAWDAATGNTIPIPNDKPIGCPVGFEVRGNRLFPVFPKWLVFYNLNSGEQEAAIPLPHRIQNGYGNALSLDREGRNCAIACDNFRKPILLDLSRDPPEVDPLQDHLQPVGAVIFAPDGKTLTTGCSEGFVRSWNIASGRQTRQYALTADCLNLTTLATTRDGRLLAAGGNVSRDELGYVQIWDAANGKVVGEHALPDMAHALAFSPDGQALAVAVHSFFHTNPLPALVFQMESGETARTLQEEPSGFQAIRFLGQDRLVAVGRGFFTWDLDNDMTNRVIDVGNTYNGAWLSGDGTWLGVSDGDTIALWNMATGKLAARVKGRPGFFGTHAVAFSSDSRLLATTWRGDSIHISETATGKELLQLASPDCRVCSQAFSPDNRLVATGMADGTVVLWDVSQATRN